MLLQLLELLLLLLLLMNVFCSTVDPESYWLESMVVMQNFLANALLIVTAVTPHTMARRVHIQATSDLFLPQNARIFRLEFFANTVLRH